MKRYLLSLSLAALATGTIFNPVLRADEDAKEVLTKAQKAQLDAPACRIQVISTDTANNKSSTMTIEFVKPDLVHWKMEENGEIRMEMWSEGKKTSMRRGPNGEVKEAPLNMSTVLAKARESASMEAMIGMTREFKFVGHENVGGVPASVYTFKSEVMGLNSTTKLWISETNNRPLKAEGETHGEMKVGSGPGQATNKKSVTTYEYDPAIKIIVPAH